MNCVATNRVTPYSTNARKWQMILSHLFDELAQTKMVLGKCWSVFLRIKMPQPKINSSCCIHKLLIPLFVVMLLSKGISSEISDNPKTDDLDATLSSTSTLSLVDSTSEKLQTTKQLKKEKTLKFVTELKNVTKEAGGNLRLRCAVTGSVPATKFEWFSNEAPLMEGNYKT